MSHYSIETQQSFRDLGYEPCWAEDIQVGDDIAISGFLTKEVEFFHIESIRRSAPQYEKDGSFGFGRILNADDPHYVYGFVGVRDDDSKAHLSYGRGYPMWRKRPQPQEDAS